MRIRLRLFAICRDRVGRDHLDLELSSVNPTVRELLRCLPDAAPELAPLLPAVRVAVNQRFADADQALGPDDEVALIPPVSGGGSEGRGWLQAEPLDPRAVEATVAHPGAGAVVTFQGAVRNRTGEHDVTHLDYEAYDGMAQRVLQQVGEEAEARWPGVRVAVAHRTGRVEVGEVSVVIAVSSPHRDAAFEACRYVIERLKQDVPIWKKEVDTNGEAWIGQGP